MTVSVQVLLKISDCSDDSGGILIEFISSSAQISYKVESFTSPITQNFRESLDWYYEEYLVSPESGEKADRLIEKMIRAGQYLGDEILGEDHQLLKVVSELNKSRYDCLEVVVESNRIEFLSECWELMVLPESKYILAAASRVFYRTIQSKSLAPQNTSVKTAPIYIEPGLEKHPIESKVKGIGGLPPQDIKVERINILHFVSRQLDYKSTSCSISSMLNFEREGSVLRYGVVTGGWCDLKKRIEGYKNKLHIFHFDGPIDISEGIPAFVIGEANERVGTVEFCSYLVEQGVHLLCIDDKTHMGGVKNHLVSCVLAKIAKTAIDHGLKNIVGLSQATNALISSRCFSGLYESIVDGNTFRQAVVEARKKLQKESANSLLHNSVTDIQVWPLFVHYSHQDIKFFFPPDETTYQNLETGFDKTHQKMHGFRVDMLPPMASYVFDGAILTSYLKAYNALQSKSFHLFSIQGDAGCGKTHTVHGACFLLALYGRIELAFRFDMSVENYSCTDMLSMVATVLEVEISKKNYEAVEKALSKKRCCFVFDNLKKSADHVKGLHEFVARVGCGNHVIFAVGNNCENVGAPISIEYIDVDPLSLTESKYLAINLMNQKNLKIPFSADDWKNLLTFLGGNPWLIKKVFPLISKYEAGGLLEDVKSIFSSRYSGDYTSGFYLWQWKKLSLDEKKLYLLCGKVKGLLLEMLMVSIDQKYNFEPARQLLIELGSAGKAFKQLINDWDQAGLLIHFPHGRMIDERCLEAITKNDPEILKTISSNHIQLKFSHVICEGVRISSENLQVQFNQSIFNNLILNRRSWAASFEVLWAEGEHADFLRYKRPFDLVLNRAGLQDESYIWISEILMNSELEFPISIKNLTPDKLDCYIPTVILSRQAVNAKEVLLKADFVAKKIHPCEQWFKSFDISCSTEPERQLLRFSEPLLNYYYYINRDWNQSIFVSRISAAICADIGEWNDVVRLNQNISHCFAQLGENVLSTEIENKFLSEVPFDKISSQYKFKIMIEVATARYARGDLVGALDLLDALKDGGDVGFLAYPANRLRADIYMSRKEYMLALPLLCSAWDEVCKKNIPKQMEQIGKLLQEIKHHVGEERFSNLFSQQTSSKIPLG